MIDSTVAICILARDCERTLLKNIRFIERLRSYFRESYVVVVENDSQDNTKTILKAWEKEARQLFLYSNDYNLSKFPRHPRKLFLQYAFSKERIERMSTLRNIYLNHVKQNLNVDFLIAIDFDVYKIDLEGILNSFGFEKEWDCITSNGKKITSQNLFVRYFYDSFAFKEMNDTQPVNHKILKETQRKYRNLKRGMDLLQVRSGFNALAIYKWGAIKSVEYRVKENPDQLITSQCEHLTLHEDMINLGFSKIYLNPSQIVVYERLSLKWYYKNFQLMIKDLIY